jgi:hypothetical protein
MKAIQRIDANGVATTIEVANNYVLKTGETLVTPATDETVNEGTNEETHEEEHQNVLLYDFEDVPKNGVIKDVLAYLKKCANATIQTVKFVKCSVMQSDDSSVKQYAVQIDLPVKTYKGVDNAGVKEFVESTTQTVYLTAMDFERLVANSGYPDLSGGIARNPLLANVLLKGATISIVGIEFAVGDIFSNPFAKQIKKAVEAINPKVNYYAYASKLNPAIAGAVSKRIEEQLAIRMTNDFFANSSVAESESKEADLVLD